MSKAVKKITWGLLVLLGMGGVGPVVAATNTNIANAPLAGITQNFPANVFLALSVEFPTAGAAYYNTALNSEDLLKTSYRGYFDANKCYTLEGVGDNRYFKPSKAAGKDGGILGLCNSGSVTNEYSGNVLNWATMTALDVYRSAMTGGNRALGVGVDAVAYQNGDTADKTYLRRANVVSGQNAGYRLTGRTISLSKKRLKQLIPASYISEPNKDVDSVLNIKFDNNTFSAKIKYDISNFTGYEQITTRECQGGIGATCWGGRWVYVTKDDLTKPIYKVVSQEDNIPVVVNVCAQGLLEGNCSKYGSNFKPEGLMQQNISKMNFSALGYLNISGASTGRSGGNQISGGVVRSELGTIKPELNTGTGQFVINPFPQADTDVGNSGSINYLNKFGDANGYKTNDPVAELFYTTLRYMRGMGYVNNNNWIPDSLTKVEKDNFPVVNIKSKDPFKDNKGQWDMQKVCSRNTIMLIGDTNSHKDGNLPQLSNKLGFMPTDDNAIDTTALIKTVKEAELSYIGAPIKSTFMDKKFNENMGSADSPAGLPALAYWAHTQNMRAAELPQRAITAQTFAIDVLENNGYKVSTDSGYNWVNNSYYLAAKYGSFDDKNHDGLPSRSDPSEWTDDSVVPKTSPVNVISSIPEFTYGKPRNYALANNPDSMVSALTAAFNSAGAAPGASQTGIGTSSGANVFDEQNSLAIRSTYVDTNWSGDIVGFRIVMSGSQVAQARVWSANDLLKTNTNRQIFANTGSSIEPFTVAKAASFSSALGVSSAANLIAYMRGDTSQEVSTTGGVFRPRQGDKMGTVINSQVISVLRPTTPPKECTYTDGNVLKRNTLYGVASNDGMYHVFDAAGNEKMAYIPSTALPKLQAYATPGYQHKYINDGLSTTAEVCFGSGDGGAHSVIVGTTGRGGRSVYALDVTNFSTPSANNVLWEFSKNDDPDLGYTIGKPTITKDTLGRPVVVVSSGYNSDSDNGYIFVLQLNKSGAWVQGQNYQKIKLGSAGVGSPFVFDLEQDGTANAIYAGDLDGKMWKVEAKSNGEWAVAFGGAPLIKVPTGSFITAAPFVQMIEGKTTVFFGTGRYFSDTDFNTGVQNYAYGVFDTGSAITSGSKILEQTIFNQAVAGHPDLWALSNNAIDTDHVGWRIRLRVNQMIVDQATVMSRTLVYFTVFTPQPLNNCLTNSETFLLGASVRNGGQYPEPIFDTNGDGTIDALDGVGGFYKISDASAPVGTIVQTTTGGSLYLSIGSDGNLVKKNIHNPTIPVNFVKYRRLSWREIF